MSWYIVDGATFTIGVIEQKETWSIGVPSWWHWDLVGFADDRLRRRLV